MNHEINYACISPGARNSPLTYAFIKQNKIKCFSHIDERSSAFFALGLAKSLKKPIILISTSGTAPANYYPAIIEAKLSEIPLIILSADRPPDLIGTGSNQTINQQNLYGEHVNFYADVGLPKNDINDLEKTLSKAIDISMGVLFTLPPGPIHLNFPFDEPLLPEDIKDINMIKYSFPKKNMDKNFNSKIKIDNLNDCTKPIIVVGPMHTDNYNQNILDFAKKLEAPILADPLSQIRFGVKHKLIMCGYDHYLEYLDEDPDLVIRFGKKPTSKILCKLLKKWNHITKFVGEYSQFNDDSINYIHIPIDMFCLKQSRMIKYKKNIKWSEKIINYEKKIQNIILNFKNNSDNMIIKACQYSLLKGDFFIIGNSMPIRLVDMFTLNSNTFFNTFSNRGASGIDGVVSTALGIAISEKLNRSLLLIGDVSFYHDMSGLLTSTKYKINLTIVVINNNGGGIFSLLPIANLNINGFDEYWTTNASIDIATVAKLYGCKYNKINQLDELPDCIKQSFEYEGIKIIEIISSINEETSIRYTLRNKIKKSMNN